MYKYTSYATLKGWGSVGLSGNLVNNGYMIADGYGQERSLDLSSFGNVFNTIDNDMYDLSGNNDAYYGKGETGWFAVNSANLVLPLITVNTGAGAYNWGESSGDTDIDLINSIRLDFANVTVGDSLAISLLADDRSEVSDSVGNILGIWKLAAPSLAFTTVDITVRYDDVMAATQGIFEGNIKLFRRDGWRADWVDITASVNTVTKVITAANVNALGTLAVGKDIALKPPPRGTIFLME